MPSLHSIIRHGIIDAFPAESPGEEVTDISRKTGLSESLVCRLLGHAASHRIFEETRPGFFEHTAASRQLAKHRALQQWIIFGAEEILPACLRVSVLLFANMLS